MDTVDSLSKYVLKCALSPYDFCSEEENALRKHDDPQALLPLLAYETARYGFATKTHEWVLSKIAISENEDSLIAMLERPWDTGWPRFEQLSSAHWRVIGYDGFSEEGLSQRGKLSSVQVDFLCGIAIQALGDLRSARAIPVLTSMLPPRREKWWQAARALAHIGDASAEGALVTAISAAISGIYDHRMVDECASALAELGCRKAAPEIVKKLFPERKRNAELFRALTRLGAYEAIDEIYRIFENAGDHRRDQPLQDYGRALEAWETIRDLVLQHAQKMDQAALNRVAQYRDTRFITSGDGVTLTWEVVRTVALLELQRRGVELEKAQAKTTQERSS